VSSRLLRILPAVIVSIVCISAGRVAAQTRADSNGNAGGTVQLPHPKPANSESEARVMLRQIGSDFRHFPSLETALWVGGGGTVSLVARPNEKRLNVRFAGDEWVDDVYDGGYVIGAGYTQVGAAILTYVVGKSWNAPKVQHLGSDLIRSHVLAGVPTLILKQAVQRERPDHGHTSFPSGHASVTFASATVLQRHLGWRGGIPAYLVATWVAASRLHENQHYASDVLFGAAIGIAAGRTVTRHGRTTWALVPAASVSGGGIGIAVTRIPGGSGAAMP
jgi:PAP2 superfamily